MSHENIKKHCHEKNNCLFLKLWWRKFLKVAAFVIFPTSIMVLFEIHQSFKGYILNELRFSFNRKLHFSYSVIFLRVVGNTIVNLSLNQQFLWKYLGKLLEVFLNEINLSFLQIYSKKWLNRIIFRSSHQRCSVKIRNFPKFTGKHLRQSLVFY